MEFIRGLRASTYIFFEMLPSFILGLFIFVSIILMFQVLRLTEFTLVHGVHLSTISEVIFYICIALLPALFPMSLLFSVLLTYGRLSQDSEIVAMKACGISMKSILGPAILIGTLVGVVSAQTSFYIAPWGNRQFEVLFTQLGHTKAAATIKDGTFSEGFFDLVVYANKVDTKTGELTNVFIYDEKQSDIPLTIIAKKGHLIPDPNAPGHNVLLRLEDGDIHRKAENHTKIKFDTYDVRLIEPFQIEEKEKTPPSLTLKDVQEALEQPNLKPDEVWTLETEFHKRWAISVLCPIFALIGLGLGINTNRRQQKSNTMTLCVFVIIVYWVLYVACEGLARTGKIPPILAMWTPNFIFGLFSFWKIRENWN